MVSIYTVGEMCKKCYSCVRVCPTKAIEVHGGQANIIEEKCISCGHCVPRCSQGAKRVRSSVAQAQTLLAGAASRPVRVMLAPSFPAAFLDAAPERVVGALAQCGFAAVHEVAFGADLVSYAYHELYASGRGDGQFLISSPCPAVVSFVEKMHPELVPHLAPVKSPMEAMAMVIRERLDPAAAIVFVGPCVAKKDEAGRSDLVDAVLTYAELVELFEALGIDYRRSPPREFDPPLANLGKIYPVTGGLLKAASIDADILESRVSVVEGSSRVSDILEVLSARVERGDEGGSAMFDLLFCEGCIAGPIMPNELTFYERKKYIVDYMKRRPLVDDIGLWAETHGEYLDLDFGKSFRAAAALEPVVPPQEITRILALTGKLKSEDELNCRACGYESCRDKAVAVYRGIAEVEMCLPYLISKLEVAIRDLTDNQQKLIQAEKLASMGQMAAGIAHEINNPLGVVLMYAHLLKDEIDGGEESGADVERIIREAERARQIVKGILNFARKEHIRRESADVNALLGQSVEAFRARSPAVRFELELDRKLQPHEVDADQMRQVFDNIIANAVEAGSGSGSVRVRSEEESGGFRVLISDSGPGIPEEALPRLFTPFFTTKPPGKGTGLGLAVCYGIVKMHGGSIQAGNAAEGGAFFEIRIRDPGTESSEEPLIQAPAAAASI
ncbi:MAG TPA: [Fe-Fe] hydrogenase large subunit C-terminal domain-containing protein [Rectinemataceae bacterium]|nr:[Fe-Fe] hydrogenase large subunit C-terminal domain-containing protein [Rectinemataceae bacterium]